ncbi:MerR family transcriptional regulator [Streptomyces castrisilvae]|uniref:MerR family transcriptional regulator n=1 Tax=Streptomyces castrisilvae TaxID=3033811 RepID=A0ABY9HIP5_9ACTN|nr:MerR family transcriptional regulator [Streptomyces sp. Mut1]WLQ34345.1 MerR family transcriptional regulator [Streptomyces sp. Mut1]
MDGSALYSIGEVARRTGLSVKTIRFYSDRGIVTPADRTPAGYRRYTIDAVARLELVRTLRELGIDLPTVRRVADQELPLPEVAAAHADALAIQIRVLRLRHALLTAVAERRLTPEETDLMHQLAQLPEDERRRLVDDFLGAVFDGLATDDPALTGVARTMTPQLPAAPEAEQTRAWAEWAELTLDPEFRAYAHHLFGDLADERARSGTAVPRPGFAATVRDLVAPALAAGTDPASPPADPIVTALVAAYARIDGHAQDAGLRHRLLLRLETVNDPRRERYFRLLAVINDWPAPESLTPALDWATEAVRVRTR